MVLRGLRRPYSGCYRQRPPRSLQRHPAREPDHPRRAIAGPQRRCCPRPCEQPALLVFLNTIQVTRTPHVFFFAKCSPDGRIAMALLSATRSTSPPPILEADLRAGRGGVAQLGVSAMVVLLLFALLVRSAASAPGFRSGFRSGLGCASFGRWARPCVRGATRAGSAASRRRWW